MRHGLSIFGIFVVLFSFQFSFAQTPTWTNITPPGWSGDLKFITFLDGGKLLAASDSGYLYASLDTGKTFTVAKAPVANILDMKFYPDGKRGFIVSNQNLYHTTDAGAIWQNMPMTGLGTMKLYQLYIKSEDTLLVAAGDLTIGAKILLSSDTGKTWKKVADNLFCNSSNVYDHLNSFFFDTPKHGYALAQGYYATTNDGGNTWTKTSQSTGDDFFSAITNSAGDIIFTNSGYIYDSPDGNLSNPNELASLSPYTFASSRFTKQGKSMYVVDDYGELSTSRDNGNTWTTITLDNNTSNDVKHYYDITFIDSTTGIVCGSELTMYKTTDAGATWNKIVYGTGEGTNTVYCKTTNDCYIGGFSGRLFHTTDGGTNWTWKDLGTGSTIQQITFPTADTGYVSVSGLIYRTIDGGVNWHGFTQTTSGSFMQFPSKDTGYVGYTSTYPYIEKTTDAGQTWNIITNINADGRSACFRNANIGLVSTAKGLWYTTDGGSTWNLKTLNFGTQGANEIFDLNGRDWIVMGGAGQIYKCDKDINCTLKYFNNPKNQTYMSGIKRDSLHIYLFDEKDTIIYSQDGGETWAKDTNFIQGQVFVFPQPNIGYLIQPYNIFKTVMQIQSIIKTFTKMSDRVYTCTITTGENSPFDARIYIVNSNNDTTYLQSTNIVSGVPFTITIPSQIPQGNYSIKIQPTDSLLYSSVQSSVFTIDSTKTDIVETERTPLLVRIVGNTIVCNCQTPYEIYSTLGQRMQNNSALPVGVYIVRCNNVVQKVIINP